MLADYLPILLLFGLSTLVLAPAYKPAIAFAILILMLIVRPTGLFAGRST